MRSRFVEAVVKATGRKQIIPKHWLSDPVLSQGFVVDPPEKPAPRQRSRRKR